MSDLGSTPPPSGPDDGRDPERATGAEPAAPRPGAPGGPVLDAEAITTAERTQLQVIFKRFLRHRPAIVSLVLLLAIVAFAFLGPLVYPWDHTISRDIPSNLAPGGDHPLGTTSAGNDVLGLLMRGTQQSLKVAGFVMLVTTVIGSLYGITAGYLGGRIDGLMMRIVDMLLAIPLLVLIAAVAGNVTAGTNWFAIAFLLGIFGWTTLARVTRSETLSLKEREFIEAAKAMGASDVRIIFSHLLPNTAGVIIVAATLTMATAVLAEAGLSFLGLGIQPPDTSLGLQIEQARTAVFTRPYLFYPPGLVLVGIALTVNFLGDGLRDALDPRQTITRR